MIRLLAAAALLVLTALPGAAFELTLPQGARQVSERISDLGSYALPLGPFDGSTVPDREIEGRIERQTWRIESGGLTTLQVLAPLRDQLEAAGFELVFQCRDIECGGFDFRFKTEVVPAPDMYVDIRSYRFISATRGADEAISLLVSHNRSATYVQVVYVNRDGADAPAPLPLATEDPTPETAPGDLIETLQARGHVVLGDLVFESGSATLDPAEYASLEKLSAYLKNNPGLKVGLVGHTDAVGSLDQNISLSKRRAQSVRTRLVDKWGIAPDRIEAEGMGYLAPVASNLTPEGRDANRRVEVILLSDR